MGDATKLDGISKVAHEAIDGAASVEDAAVRLRRLIEHLETIMSLSTGSPAAVELERLREWVDEVERRHAIFVRQLAPLGWALSPFVQDTGHYLIVAKSLELKALTPLQADRALAAWLLEWGDHDAFLNRIADTPLHGVWRWTWIAGEAMNATLRGNGALAAFGWLVIAEGMWRDVEGKRTGSRPKGFYSKSRKRKARRFGDNLPWPEASLAAAQQILGRESGEIVDEPLGNATTNRHGLLHGNVAGFISLHHAVKTMTVVDALVDMAIAYVRELPEGKREPTPWQSDALKIGSTSIRHGPLPGMRPLDEVGPEAGEKRTS